MQKTNQISCEGLKIEYQAEKLSDKDKSRAQFEVDKAATLKKEVMESQEIVYVLSNSAMPGILKIGKTTQADVISRMNQLYTTGVPVPFECVYAIEVEDCSKVESALHIGFGPSRINPRREFFEIESEQAIAILKLVETKDVTPEVARNLNKNLSEAEKNSGKKLKKLPNMNFADMNIPVGSKLLYRDGETEVEVKSDRKVCFNDNTMTLTAATREITNSPNSLRPSPLWTFNGRLLKEIYDETYAEESI